MGWYRMGRWVILQSGSMEVVVDSSLGMVGDNGFWVLGKRNRPFQAVTGQKLPGGLM
ncbi:hypothetical protein Hdeb2414_s0024g00645891 [Helianthus debilis subsp. tardiflorus]